MRRRVRPWTRVVPPLVASLGLLLSMQFAPIAVAQESVADLSVTKTDDFDPVKENDPLTYTVTVVNGGPDPATGGIVVDDLPASVRFTGADPECAHDGAIPGGRVTCELSDSLAVGATHSVSISVVPMVAETIVNTVEVWANEPDPDETDNVATEETEVRPDDQIAEDAQFDVAILQSNGSVIGHGTVNCPPFENGTVSIAVFQDEERSSGAVRSGQTRTPVDCTGEDVPWTVHATQIVGSGVEPGLREYTIKVQFEGGVGHKDLFKGVVEVQAADLELTKTASPSTVTAGETLTYTLEVTNHGDAEALGVVVTDPLPEGMLYESGTPSQGVCSESGGTVTCELGDLAAGAAAAADIVVTPTVAGAVSNTASVASVTGTDSHGQPVGVADPEPANNSATAEVTVTPAWDLSVTGSDEPDPVVVGGTLTYTFSVANGGPGTATGVVLTDALPSGVTFQSASTTHGTCSHSGGTVTCPLGDIDTGGTATVSIVVTPSTEGTLTNTASVSSSAPEADTDVSNDQDTVTTTVEPAPVSGADLSLTKADSPDPVVVGSSLTYTVVVTNAGPAAASSVVVNDPLPENVKFKSVTTTQGKCGLISPSRTVKCSFGEVASGATDTAEIVVAPSASGTLTNTATVSSGTSDPDTSNNSATETTTVTP